MRLFIAEKPSVAKAIVSELGKTGGASGYVECRDGSLVTWCFGHLLEQAEPDAYLPEDVPVTKKGRKIWRMQDLPIFPEKWKLLAKSDKGVKAQLRTIKALLGKCTSVVNAGDPDREGQLLVDEILSFYENKKPVQRFWVSAQDPTSIRRGLKSLKDNSNFTGMKLAALGRSRADWLLGMNLTRALTLSYSSKEDRKLIAVGRVQTPTLQLVASRDEAIKSFKPVPFFVPEAELFSVTGKFPPFKVLWKPKEGQKGLDTEGRLIDETEARKLASLIGKEKEATVLESSSVQKKSPQPKGFSLADIQVEANRRFGYSAQEILDTCQSLYEKHKVTSYPRSDCEYLPESQFPDASDVLKAIASTCPALSPLVKEANPTIRSAIWNDKKISAHHAIIPTRQNAEWSELTEKERNIYDLIARRYLAQFYPPEEYLENSVKAEIAGEIFAAKGRSVLKEGWKKVLGKEAEGPEDKKEQDSKVPSLKTGETLPIKGFSTTRKMTAPPKAFTEGTLIAAMEKIHTVVENPEHKKFLKESDGIGTPATRAAIIQELKRKKYLTVKGKSICATPDGVGLLKVVPPLIKNPVLTAVFERQLKDVESGKMKLADFIQSQKDFILKELSKLKGKAR